MKRKGAGLAGLLVVLGWMFATCSPAFAQKLPPVAIPQGRPALRTFTDSDGLPQNSIQTLAFDRQGYLWAGTQDGAAFFNGRAWTVVNMPNRGLSNFVRTMLVATDGSLWFGTDGGGLSHFEAGKWTTYTTAEGLPHNQVKALLETRAADGSPILWVGTKGGLACRAQGRWKTFGTAAGIPNPGILSLLESVAEDGSKRLWVGTQGGGLALFSSGSAAELTLQQVFSVKSGELRHDVVFRLLETTAPDGSKMLWAGTYGGGLTVFHRGLWKTFDTAAGLPNNIVLSLLETKSSGGGRVLWVGTYGGGLIALNPDAIQTAQVELLSLYDVASGTLTNNAVVSLLESAGPDGLRTLWVGTNGGGLARLVPHQWTTIDKTGGLPNNLVLSLLESTATDGSPAYWVGTRNGLAHFSNGRWETLTTKTGLPNDLVLSLAETVTDKGSRTLWVGTNGGGLGCLAAGRWTTFNSQKGLPNDAVLCLLATQTGDGTRLLWIGTDGGGLVQARLTETDSLEIVKIHDVATGALPNNVVFSLLETVAPDGLRTLWVGTNGGLATLTGKGMEWPPGTTYTTANGLPNNGVNGLTETVAADGTHSVWAGTYGGAARLDLGKPASWTVFSDTTRVALPNNTIYQIRQDAQKRIYLFTNKGIARLTPRVSTAENPAEYEVYTFTTEDGLPSNECNAGASLLDRRGRIWAGTVEGAALFDPAQETADRWLKPLIFERVTQHDRVFADQLALTSVQGGSFSHRENQFIFEFALLSYFRAADTRYRVQLVGFDGEPSKWTTEPRKEYTNLGAGSYIFKVWGRDYAGNVTGPLELAFEIRPAPWRTWWALTGLALALFALGYGSVQLRLKALQRQNAKLEARVRERTLELDEKNTKLASALDELAASKRETEVKNQELVRKNDELVRSKEDLVESHKRAERIFTALADVLPGTVLDEKYRLDHKIGAGGFGAVYRATHLGLQRPVAVKVFRPAGGNASVESLERFRLEGVNSCRINHPNAVAVLDSGISSGGIAYLVMELLVGHTLTGELQNKHRLSLSRCAEIVIPVCRALAEAHSAGLIHRDIKPDNVFLHQGKEGEVVKVVDFGIAKLMGDTGNVEWQTLTEAGGLVGTPTYMPPERLANKPYDGRADIYSLGVMLYQMLGGQPPFRALEGNLVSLVLMHIREAVPPLSRLVSNIPDEVEALVQRTLAKDPAQRPTAAELADELNRLAALYPNWQAAPLPRQTHTIEGNIPTGEGDDLPTISLDMRSDTSEQDAVETRIVPERITQEGT
ncbi:MAG: protein kinase [Blastocatellia bacterium]|nr:protein kinase [Blastocatellia bacterium]